ncbi:MAG: autotransporter domain-containing protein [Akkermansia sp.]|nr:autotransporter domain-containing protein [Akkermansia sp.]
MRTLFILTLFAAMSASVTRAFATVSTASTASEFVTLWNTGVSTITLSNNINLGGTELPEPGGPLTITSGTAGDAYMLIASSPLVNVNLENVKLENSQAGQGALVQLTEGYQGQVSDTIINSAYSTGDGGAVHVEDGAELTVNGGSSFTNNKAEEMGGAIAVADQTDDSTPHLVLLAQNGKNITFSSNESEVKDSTVGSIGNPNDIYLGKNGCMQLTADSESEIQILSGVASSDSSAAIVKTGKGTATLGNGSDYHGSLAVDEGTVVMAQDAVWGDGSESLTLGIKEGATLELQRGAYVNGSLTSAGTLAVTGNTTIAGGLETTGAAAVLKFSAGATLTMNGTLTLGDGVTFLFDGFEQGRYQLVYTNQSYTYNSVQLGTSELYTYSIDYQQHAIFLTVEKAVIPDEPEIPDTPVTPDEPEIPDTPVTPDEPEIPDTPVTPDEPEIPDTPVTPDEPEIPDGPVNPDKPEKLEPFRPGAKPVLVGGDIDKNTEVILTEKGNVTLEGKVNAGAITVNSDKNITFKSNKKKPGSLAGDGDLTKTGKGALTLNDGNSSWTGDTYLKGGTIKVQGASSLGKGDVYVQGGTLNLGSKAIGNDIIQSKDAAIKSGKKFAGTYTLEGGELQKGSTLNISKTATLESGTVNGTLSGTGTTEVTGRVTLGDKGKITTNALSVTDGGNLTTSAKGLSMNSKVSAVSVKEGSLTLGGKLSAFSLKLDDGTLRTSSSKPAALTLKGDVELRNDSDMQINGKLSAIDLDIRDSSLVLSNSSKPQSVTLKGNATLSSATADINGKFTANRLTLDASSLKLSGSKPQNLTVKQGLSIRNDSELSLNGKLSAAELTLSDSALKLSNSTKPQSVTVKGNATLSYATADINGKFTANNLKLTNSELRLGGARPQNLTVKQNLTIGSDSRITLNGKLSAGSLSIQKDGKLTMSGSKPVTLKVKGALTLASGSSIILDYDFVQGKTYNLLTFGHYTGSQDFYSIFGVDEDDCTIQKTDKAITMTLTGNWNPQGPRAVAAAETELLPAAAPAVVEANPVADALVQSNWGQLEASRAFVNAIANRSMAVQLVSGEGAVWASAIGSSSRHSSAGGHAGADTNVSGGAFGLETQVGRASLFGLALGNSWTRVSAHGFGSIEQDTTHLGIYGRSNWSSGIAADWSAAYGRSESETMGSDWSQKHLQLDGRVSYNHELTASTVLSPFAGVQYYASDSATVDGTSTGSLQNLRAEIGVGASHRTGRLGVYGEIALHQDIARNNPKVEMEGLRYSGMNPGRTGLNFTVGASYELTEKWSVNASYTGEFVENANAHSANVGASYKF